MELEYERSEPLLGQHLPGQRRWTELKDRRRQHHSRQVTTMPQCCFADIAGFTERASDMEPDQLNPFPRQDLRRLRRVGRQARSAKKSQGQRGLLHGGQRRASAAEMSRRGGFAPPPLALKCPKAPSLLRIRAVMPLAAARYERLPSGPVVAGEVGSRRFFYDVWGDAGQRRIPRWKPRIVGQIQVNPRTSIDG